MVCQNNNTNKQDLPEILKHVQAIDLERITRKVQRKQGWDIDRANQVEQLYRRYLALLLLYPDRQIAPPSSDADEIWHSHILDTPAYQKDCEELFGAFLHHIPSYATAEEKLQMAAAREETETLFERHFGDSTPGKEQEESFCVCMDAKPDQPQQSKPAEDRTEGCVPCLGRTDKRKEAAHSGDGCVPCFARTKTHSKFTPAVGVL